MLWFVTFLVTGKLKKGFVNFVFCLFPPNIWLLPKLPVAKHEGLV